MRVNFYEEVSNYISNELGLSKEDVEEIINKVVNSKIEERLNARLTVDKLDIIIENRIGRYLNENFRYNKRIQEMMQNILEKNYSFKIQEK